MVESTLPYKSNIVHFIIYISCNSFIHLNMNIWQENQKVNKMKYTIYMTIFQLLLIFLCPF